MEEQNKKEENALFATLTQLRQRWKDGTFGEIIGELLEKNSLKKIRQS